MTHGRMIRHTLDRLPSTFPFETCGMSESTFAVAAVDGPIFVRPRPNYGGQVCGSNYSSALALCDFLCFFGAGVGSSGST